jgi:hypothetical protein
MEKNLTPHPTLFQLLNNKIRKIPLEKDNFTLLRQKSNTLSGKKFLSKIYRPGWRVFYWVC